MSMLNCKYLCLCYVTDIWKVLRSIQFALKYATVKSFILLVFFFLQSFYFENNYHF